MKTSQLAIPYIWHIYSRTKNQSSLVPRPHPVFSMYAREILLLLLYRVPTTIKIAFVVLLVSHKLELPTYIHTCKTFATVVKAL